MEILAERSPQHPETQGWELVDDCGVLWLRIYATNNEDGAINYTARPRSLMLSIPPSLGNPLRRIVSQGRGEMPSLESYIDRAMLDCLKVLEAQDAPRGSVVEVEWWQNAYATAEAGRQAALAELLLNKPGEE
jgi:hypothetical protein